MLLTPDSMNDGWLAAYKGGKTQSTSRVTVQRMNVALLSYDNSVMNSVTLQGSGVFASMPFGQPSIPVELKNLRSVTWTRSTQQFTAEGTIVLTNTEALAVGVLADEGEFDRPGAYTFQRGDSAEGASRWNHVKNKNNGLIVPDRLIHIYQGYGTDPDLPPEQDPYLTKSFTGLIDTVVLNSDKSLTIQFRDIGRALMDTIYWPDVVPWTQYGQDFFKYNLETSKTPVPYSNTSGKWIHPKYQTDSNVPYIGRGFDDGGRAYVQSNGGINGHLGKHAFDSSNGSYFLSVGNYPNWSSSYEFVQGTFKSGSVTKVKIKAYGGPYTGYISLKRDGEWLGGSKIPYRARVVDTNADIKFVKKFHIKKGETKTIRLPKVYTDVTAIRVTMTDLWDSNVGNYQYRAGIADVQVFKSNTLEGVLYPLERVGNVSDYTTIVAWLLAWGGFFWPRDSSGFSYVTQSDGTKINYVHSPQDSLYRGVRQLPHGRIWGDLQYTGTAPISPIKFGDLDKQPLSDCINKIKEIIGFNFFIDEAGGAIWRQPNIYELGNYVSGADGGPHTSRTNEYVTIDENETLLNLTSTVSSKNVRERIFVANVSGKFGQVTEGYNPYKSGLRRYGGWTDTHFESLEEAKVMADLITLRQFMTYRENTLTIPANPMIQIDDQVKVYEKVSSDTYFHYVTGITSTHDIASGRWTYDLTTQWLGEAPGTRWVTELSDKQLDDLTKKYIEGVGGA
jgi:hypothetical protein